VEFAKNFGLWFFKIELNQHQILKTKNSISAVRFLNKKFELLLTRRVKAYSSSGSIV